MDFYCRQVVLLLSLALSGCTTSLHDWGNYSSELYQYYKSPTPEQQVEFQTELERVFARTEAKGERPAPGLYAEYGNLLLESGNSKLAIEYFDKERNAWPESAKLMDALIFALTEDVDQDQTNE